MLISLKSTWSVFPRYKWFHNVFLSFSTTIIYLHKETFEYVVSNSHPKNIKKGRALQQCTYCVYYIKIYSTKYKSDHPKENCTKLWKMIQNVYYLADSLFPCQNILVTNWFKIEINENEQDRKNLIFDQSKNTRKSVWLLYLIWQSHQYSQWWIINLHPIMSQKNTPSLI